MAIEHVVASSTEISMLVDSHRHTLEELDLQDIDLTEGTWDDALQPLTKRSHHRTVKREAADIPIMLSIPCTPPSPVPLQPVVEVQHDVNGGRRSLRMSKWLPSKVRKPSTAQKVRNGLIGCEEQLRKVFRGSVLAWR